jgi:hypothetical protein
MYTDAIFFRLRRVAMPTEPPRILLQMRYDEAAQQYLRKLKLEQIMEAISQGTQRKITLESLDLVCAQRPDVHLFNELLVQYPLKNRKRPGQVVPDNMVVLYAGSLKVMGSYDVPFQPVRPFWVMEYVSRSNKRKDYDDNMRKYEHELQVPYYLLFAPEEQELTLYHHNGEKYTTVLPNKDGRYAIPELELEVALLDGWVRFWYRGKLLPLPADLSRQLEAAEKQLQESERQKDEERRQKEQAQRELAEQQQALRASESELATLRAEIERLQRGKEQQG